MTDFSRYSAQAVLRDGSAIEIRAQRREDEAAMLAAVAETSAQSLQRRFFAMKRRFSDQERAFFMDVDFESHVVLVAVVERAGGEAIVGGGRYIVGEPGRAEIAFIVIDAWQGRGVGTVLLQHLVGIARAAGLRELFAVVLPENRAMLRLLDKSGFRAVRGDDPDIVELALTLA